MFSRPYSKLIEILRFTLDQVEKDASFDPDNPAVARLKRSLQQKLADFKRRENRESDEETTE